MTGETPLDPAVLGRILLLQSSLPAAPDERRLMEMVAQGLSSVPGVTECIVCIEGTAVRQNGATDTEDCARCPARGETVLKGCGESCPMSEEPECHRTELRTMRFNYGSIVLRRGRADRFEPYASFIGNTANLVALYIENNRNAIQLADINRGLDAEVVRQNRDLAESEQQFRSVVQDLPALICRNRPDGVIEFVNDAYCRYFGKSREDLIGKDFFSLIPDEDREPVRRHLRTLTVDDPIATHEHQAYAVDGSIRHHRWTNRAICDDTGTVVLLQGYGTDITEQRQFEESLRESARNLSEAQRIAKTGHWIWNPQNGDLYWSEELLRIFGEAPDFAPSYDFYIASLHDDDRDPVIKAIEDALANIEPYAVDVRIRTRGGEHKNLFIWGEVSFNDEDQPVLMRGTATDITDRKRAEADLRQLQLQLLQAQKLEAVGTLAGGVAHEINNPINGIMNYARLIEDELETGNPLREFAHEIGVETARVATIVKNLLAFSRHENAPPFPAKPADIINETVALIRTIIRRDQIDLKVHLPDGLPELNCRSQQIRQVVMNLLTNARDALNERYPGFDTDKQIQLTAREFERGGRPWLRITVEDHGRGIPEEIRDRIYDPFFTTKDRTEGTGLGLSISHGIVQDHQGELTVESGPDEGTRFHLDLPVE